MRAAGFSRWTRRMVWRNVVAADAVTVQGIQNHQVGARALAGRVQPLAPE